MTIIGLSKIAKGIDVVISGGSFQYVYDKNKSALHGYAHGGMHQVARRINEEGDVTTEFEVFYGKILEVS